MAQIEQVLFNGYTTGTVEVWPQSEPVGAVWTSLTLPSPMPVGEALAWWAAALASLHGGTATWEIVDGQARLTSDDPVKVRWSETLAELLGYSWTEAAGYYEEHFGDVTPLGFCRAPVGYTMPADVEQAEVDAFRAARATALTYGRAVETRLEVFIPPVVWDALEGSTLLSGHGALRIFAHNEDDFGADDLDGALTVYPIQTLAVDRESVEDFVRVSLRASMVDPGVTITAMPMTRWGEMMSAVRYGYAPQYSLRVDGIPVLPVEWEGDLEAPDGYTLDRSLVIDRSSKIGAVIDEETGISKGFDLSAALLDTPAVRDLIQAPTRLDRLATAMDVGDTSAEVYTASLWEVGDLVHVDTECMEVTAVGAETITVSRGDWGRARTHSAGAPVTDRPLEWDGRGVRLVMHLLDPRARYVPDVSCVIWQGYTLQRPERDGVLWTLQCRDQVRRLADPLGVAASGQARWRVFDDRLRVVSTAEVLKFKVTVEDGPQENVQVRPFADVTGAIRLSEVRQRVVDALLAAFDGFGPGSIDSLDWRLETTATGRRQYRLWLTITSTSADAWDVISDVSFEGAASGLSSVGGRGFSLHNPGSPADHPTPLVLGVAAIGADLEVELDEVSGSELPTAGWVALEGEGVVSYRRYEAVTLDPDYPQRVVLTLDQTTAPVGDDLREIFEAEMAGGVELSATFYWSDVGLLGEVLPRAIASSGDGVNGPEDILPRGQGLDLPDVDVDSFERVFDGAFRALPFDLTTEAGTSLEELVRGILRLSRRGLTARRAVDGSAVQIAAVRLGPPDSGVPVTTITDRVLVASQGKRPVRRLPQRPAPRAIRVSTRVLPIGGNEALEGSQVFKDDEQRYFSKARWDLEVYGVRREDIATPGASWALQWFRLARTRQAWECDVDPTVEAQVGDIVWVDVSDPQLFDYVRGVPGYQGFARVLGAPFSLTSGVQTIQLEGGGPLPSAPLCPSIPISAVNGTATSPSSIDVPLEWLDLLARIREQSTSWKLVAYLPGQDAGRAVYTLGAVAEVGGVCRLTVTTSPSSPTVTLSTAYRLTYPPEPEGTQRQAAHVHALDGIQWF